MACSSFSSGVSSDWALGETLPTRMSTGVTFVFQAEDGIRAYKVTGVQTCALPISALPDGTDARALLAWSRTYFAAHVAPLLPADRGAIIAEVGCGWGRYLVALA